MPITRKPAVAGSFYPAAKEKLEAYLNLFLSKTKNVSPYLPKILIVPHAGLDYSGQIAAWGFRQLAGKNYTRIILLGASHRAFFDYAAVDIGCLWETPLGKIEIDEKLAEKMIDEEKIIADSGPHQEEHSLEIELIFLQKVLKNFKIVPILISQTDSQLINTLAQKISENLDDNTLLVVSTDLSHYPPYEIANKVDLETIRAILTGKVKKFSKTIQKLESQNYPGAETYACGAEAVKVGLRVAEILNLEFKKIRYANSGDISQQKDQVVGYAAIIGFQKIAEISQPLDKNAQKEALQIARRTLQQYLTTPNLSHNPNSPKNKSLLSSLGAFVTLRNRGQLRGCIGEFEPDKPLYRVIQEMAIEAAAYDPRFYPVTAKELPEITIEISVLTPKKKIKSWREIELGKHGVVIRKGSNAGTFLPQVATETGWNLEEFLSHLCSDKAGLPSNCYKNPATDIFVFEAQVFEENKFEKL